MGADQNVLQLPRYEFPHGADFEVVYIGPWDIAGKILKDRFAVTGGGYKVYFEMMLLLPLDARQRSNPRKWGFGDITDAVTGRRVWDFRSFAKPLGFVGDMTTARGEDNRTYVECRARDGTLQHRFLLANLLARWNRVAAMPVPPLTVPLVNVPEVREVTIPAPPPVTESVVVKAVPAAEVDDEAALIRADLAKLTDRNNRYMVEFVRGAFASMLRPSKYLKSM